MADSTGKKTTKLALADHNGTARASLVEEKVILFDDGSILGILDCVA